MKVLKLAVLFPTCMYNLYRRCTLYLQHINGTLILTIYTLITYTTYKLHSNYISCVMRVSE
jgi:hypothetical protein